MIDKPKHPMIQIPNVQLQNCEQRNEMIKNIFNVRALMMPSYIVNDDC